MIRTLVNTLSILEWVQEHVEHTCIQNHVGLDLCVVQNQGIWLWGEQTKALIRNWYLFSYSQLAYSHFAYTLGQKSGILPTPKCSKLEWTNHKQIKYHTYKCCLDVSCAPGGPRKVL